MNINVVIGSIGAFILSVIAFIEQYKEIVSWIALRIEKDSADGHWSHEEKEQLAVDLYLNKIRPTLPWYLRIIPRVFIEKIIRSLTKKLCGRAKKIK